MFTGIPKGPTLSEPEKRKLHYVKAFTCHTCVYSFSVLILGPRFFLDVFNAGYVRCTGRALILYEKTLHRKVIGSHFDKSNCDSHTQCTSSNLIIPKAKFISMLLQKAQQGPCVIWYNK